MYTRHTFASSTLGDIMLVASDDAIVGLYFSGHWYLPKQDAIGPRVELETDTLLGEAATQLSEYLAGSRASFDLPTVAHGTPLQEEVWGILKQIPFGATTTYGAIATQLGDRSLAQAVGQAVGHNPLSIIVPCHRVVGSTGKLTGFAGGLERKRSLLDLEAPALAETGRLF
ncbi:MAG TPA: methylated-DNA--[protein]-cysteine S-methyltransferase [Galbitalea sp.]|jgi:methylated-DNA-[protein]-cysteine S-methyltransferase